MQRAPLSLPLTRTPSCPETGLLGSSGSFVRTRPWLGGRGFTANLHLYEDADLAKRLRAVGKIALRRDVMVATSGRRYKNGLMNGLVTYAPNLLSLYLLKKRRFNRL